MTNREWIQSLPTTNFYREMAQINNCWRCAYKDKGNCIAARGSTCAEGHIKWLDLPYGEANHKGS